VGCVRNQQLRDGDGPRIVTQYVPMLLVAGANVAYVLWGTGAPYFRRAFPTPRRPKALLADFATALLGTVVIVAVEQMVAVRDPPTAESVAAVRAILPTGASSRAVWPLVACAVGISEELSYRGYLRDQLAWLSGSRSVGLLLQAILFGVAHANQGGAAAARIGMYGLVLGLMTQRRRSLFPATLCHVTLDVVAGLRS
jgi:membrane protease YdiL (CAAX protease family)